MIKKFICQEKITPFRKAIVEQAAFVVGPVPDPSNWLNVSSTKLPTHEYCATVADLGSSARFGLFGSPFFHVDVRNCSDNGKVICFSFHHIAFDGETLGTIRNLLMDNKDIGEDGLLSFSELNTKTKHRSDALHDIDTDEILEYSIAKPGSGQENVAQSYQVYESFQYTIPGDKVADIKRNFSVNANMVAFSVFSIALGRYFASDKIMVNCTEAGRNYGRDHLRGFGMLARYFPCCVYIPRPELCAETASAVVTSYWDGFNNDFSSYLSNLRRIEIDEKAANFQFSYNYDRFVEPSEGAAPKRRSISVYPKVGIFDVVVNVCSTYCISDQPDGNPSLLFKIDYAPGVICKEKLKNAFSIQMVARKARRACSRCCFFGLHRSRISDRLPQDVFWRRYVWNLVS